MLEILVVCNHVENEGGDIHVGAVMGELQPRDDFPEESLTNWWEKAASLSSVVSSNR